MASRARAGLAVTMAAALFAASHAGATPKPACAGPLAEWPVHLEAGLPVTPGSINGAAVGVMIDTGAAATVVTPAAARRLGLVARSSAERMRGIGGDSALRVTRIDEMAIGAWSARALGVHVGGELAIPGVDVVLGEDVLHTLDVEFDYPRRAIRVFEPNACAAAPVADWTPAAQELSFERDDRALRLAMEVNGVPALAMLDSGAVRTLVSLDFAYRAGLAPDAPGVVPAGCAAGLGGEVVRAWAGRFDSVRLGRETVRDAHLAFADFTVAADAPLLRAPALSYSRRSPDVLLGNDFLRAHRVRVARSEGRVYFSYAGGSVFPALPAAPCDERARTPVD